MPTADHIAQQQELLAPHRRTLAHLLRQQAAFSAGHVPAHIAHGIAEARAGIARCTATLCTWGVEVADHPDDVAPPEGEWQPRPAGSAGALQGSLDVSGRLTGTGIATNYGTAITNIYQGAAPSPDAQAALAAAQALLAQLPLATIPDVAALPKGSRMPLSRNPLFVGREGDLKALASALKGGATAAIGQVAAATGLGGIGKTNLATEFVHRYGQFFAGGVFWLSFAEAANVPAEVAACGGPGGMDLPGFAARAKQLFGDDGVQMVASRVAQAKAGPEQLTFLEGLGKKEQGTGATSPRIGRRLVVGRQSSVVDPRHEATTHDRVHAAMLLQASGQADALRALLKAEQERGPEFLRLANALSALYPEVSQEERLLDAMLLAVPR
jgi:hypothetical protein